MSPVALGPASDDHPPDQRPTASSPRRNGGTVVVAVPGEEWALGAGSVVGSLRVSRFEAFRVLGGRRTESQIRAMDWSSDIGAVLPVVSAYRLPAHPIQEG